MTRCCRRSARRQNGMMSSQQNVTSPRMTKTGSGFAVGRATRRFVSRIRLSVEQDHRGNSMVKEMTRLYPRSRRPECACYCELFRRPPVMAVTFASTAKVETVPIPTQGEIWLFRRRPQTKLRLNRHCEGQSLPSYPCRRYCLDCFGGANSARISADCPPIIGAA
jgi:hypothetical protein